MNKTKSFLHFIRNSSINSYAIFTGVLLAVVIGVAGWHTNGLGLLYERIVDPIIAISTVFIGLMIWFFQAIKSWEDSLPKRLTVHFMFDGKCQMSCYEAFLAGESDIRAWSQQIGSQMTKVKFLNFYPYLESKRPIIKYSAELFSEHRPELIQLFEVTFFLKDNDFKENPEIRNKYILWIDNTAKNSYSNAEKILDKQPDKPLSIDEVINLFREERKD